MLCWKKIRAVIKFILLAGVFFCGQAWLPMSPKAAQNGSERKGEKKKTAGSAFRHPAGDRFWIPAQVNVITQGHPPLQAQDGGQSAAPSQSQRWDFHFQSTLIGQGVFPFPAEYSGVNSLEPHGEIKDTFSFDVTGSVKLWHGGEFSADVLVWQGYGLSNTRGVAGFPNGEALRIGKTFPDAFVSRAYLRETISLGGRHDPGADQSAASGDERRLTFTVGHFPATDVFDRNAYANDPRTQFMNWDMLADAAWDFPADSLGYTNGASAELDLRSWAARLGIFQVPLTLNGMRMDWNLGQAYSLVAEVERQYALAGHPGALRLLAYRTRAHMGNYDEALNSPDNIQPDGQLGYRSKYGFGINMEQEFQKDVGAFMRLGWSDGENESWMNTDVDRTASVGISLKGEAWRRPGDTAGVAAAVNGISAAHRQFLAHGGLGITVGDGKLDYGTERILEAYYSIATRWGVSVSPDFQFVVNPGYNRDRGPAFVPAIRLHLEL
jgi:high affinity Mn2+ porin